MLCESRKHGVYFVMSYANISDRSIVSTDFLPSLSLPSSFLSHYVALWVPFLCPLNVAEWSSLLPLYQTLCFNVLGFHRVLLMKDHLFVLSACYLFWRDRSFAYISCAKINTLLLLKEGRRTSPCV